MELLQEGYETKRFRGVEDIFRDSLGLEYEDCDDIADVLSRVLGLGLPDQQLEEYIPRLESEIKAKLHLLESTSLHLRLDTVPKDIMLPIGVRIIKSSIRSSAFKMETSDDENRCLYALLTEIRLLMQSSSEKARQLPENMEATITFGFSPVGKDQRGKPEPNNVFYGHIDDIGTSFYGSDVIHFDPGQNPFPDSSGNTLTSREVNRMQDIRRLFDNGYSFDLWETQIYFYSLLAANEILNEMQAYCESGLVFEETDIAYR